MKNLNVIAKFLNTDVEALKNALESDEGADFLNDVFNTFKTNHKKIGEKIGSDLAIKSIKEKTGVEFEGKDIDTFVANFTEKIKKSIKVEPGNENKELELTKEQLKIAQNAIATKESEILTLRNKQQELEFDGYLSDLVPKTLPKGIERREALQIIKMNLPKFEKKDGKYLTEKFDDNGNIITLDNEVQTFVKTRGWNEVQQDPGTGGRGGKGKSADEGGISLKNFSGYERYLNAKGIKMNTPEADKILNEAMANNKDFNLNE